MATISGSGEFRARQPLGKSIGVVAAAVASVLLVPLVRLLPDPRAVSLSLSPASAPASAPGKA